MTLNNSQARLLSFVERIERLIAERKEISDGITSVKAEAKAAGFEPKVITQMIRERAMDESDRQEWNALCEVYRAALGLLDGTPMSDNARRRFDPPPEDDRESEASDMFDPPHEQSDDVPSLTPADARKQGGDAFHQGSRVTDNPFRASDPCRAAWDEGWCAEAGSDGMDIPPAWRRSKSQKDEKGGEE